MLEYLVHLGVFHEQMARAEEELPEASAEPGRNSAIVYQFPDLCGRECACV